MHPQSMFSMLQLRPTSKAITALESSKAGGPLVLRERLLLPGVVLRDGFFSLGSWKPAGGSTAAATVAMACSMAASAATLSACVRTSPASNTCSDPLRCAMPHCEWRGLLKI